MSEEKTTLEVETKTTPDNAAPTETIINTDELTPENIHEFRREGSRDKIRAIIASAKEKEVSEIPERKPVEKKEAAPDPKSTEEKKRVWSTRYKGKDATLPDDDGYLGLKDFGGLKKKAAFNLLRINDLEKELTETRQQLQSHGNTASEAQALRDEVTRLKAEIETVKKSPASAAPAAKTTAPEADIGEPPVAPEKEFDPMDDESIKAWGKFNRESAVYMKKMTDLIKSGGTLTREQKAELTPEARQEIDALKTELAQYKDMHTEFKNAKTQNETEKAFTAFWDRLSTFQMQHKDYATKSPLREIEPKFLKFSDDLAEANGIVKPLTAYNRKDPAWQKFEADSAALVDKYIEGDEAVKQNSDNLTPPEDFETFLRTINLSKKRDDYIAQGRLNKNSTLDDAWHLDLKDSGRFEELVTSIEKDATTKGVKSTVEAMKNVQREYATTIPPDQGGQEIVPGVNSVEEAQTILKSTPQELAADPELRKKHKALLRAMSED